MAAIHTPAQRRKTTTRRHTGRRLPHLGWGWIIVALGVVGVAKTWPVLTALTTVLIGAALILRAIQPAWLTRFRNPLPGLSFYRPALPAPGRRTVEAFHRLSPGRFEQAIAELAQQDHNVTAATVVGGAGDGGMDVRVKLANGSDVLIQCKRYRKGNNVPARDVRDTNGAYRDLHRCQQAAIVTTADFTRNAYATNAQLTQRLRLVNGDALTAWANGTGPAPWR